MCLCGTVYTLWKDGVGRHLERETVKGTESSLGVYMVWPPWSAWCAANNKTGTCTYSVHTSAPAAHHPRLPLLVTRQERRRKERREASFGLTCLADTDLSVLAFDFIYLILFFPSSFLHAAKKRLS